MSWVWRSIEVIESTQQTAYLGKLAQIQADIRMACERVQRHPEDIRMIAVTKTVDESALAPLLGAGVREFGENRWQQAKPKLEHPLAGQAIWHFIGHLQLNKAKYIAPRFQMVHSVDSFELAQALSHYRSLSQQEPLRLLLQVNISGEETKSGLRPAELQPVAQRILQLPHVLLDGLMTMAPQAADIELTRPVFRGLRSLRDELSHALGIPLPQLSMGMSGDFTVAVEEGATMVRIGRRLLEVT